MAWLPMDGEPLQDIGKAVHGGLVRDLPARAERPPAPKRSPQEP
jgi:hypothetical protein